MKQKGSDFEDSMFPFAMRRWIPWLDRFSLQELEHGGVTTKRILASTGLVAFTFGLMRLIPSLGAAVFVIPIWAAAFGCMLGGYRGA
ncbi:MAG: hypothetical protein AAF483_00590, partial [Planctomycetota bacterium]